MNELTFNEATRNVIGVYRGTARVADICKIDGRNWALIAGGSMCAFGTRGAMRRYAVKWLCECADCRAKAAPAPIANEVHYFLGNAEVTVDELCEAL